MKLVKRKQEIRTTNTPSAPQEMTELQPLNPREEKVNVTTQSQLYPSLKDEVKETALETSFINNSDTQNSNLHPLSLNTLNIIQQVMSHSQESDQPLKPAEL